MIRSFMSNAAIEQERVARLRREQDEDDDRNRAVRAAQKGHDTEPPPVDEDAAAEARAYERGRADMLADTVTFLRTYEKRALVNAADAGGDDDDANANLLVAETLDAAREGLEKRAADRLATKQGAASS